MARRASPAEIVAAMDVVLFPDAEVTAERLAEVARTLERKRKADYEEFDWREERGL